MQPIANRPPANPLKPLRGRPARFPYSADKRCARCPYWPRRRYSGRMKILMTSFPAPSPARHRRLPAMSSRSSSGATNRSRRSKPRWPADKSIFLVSQLDPAEDDPDRDALYDLGVVATVLQLLKLPDGTVRVLVEGKQRATLKTLRQRRRAPHSPRSTPVESDEPEGVEVDGAGPLGDRAVRELRQGQPQAARRDRGPARPDRGAVQARRRGRRQRQHQGRRQAGPARRARPGPPAGNGLRLHGGRAGVMQVEKKIRSARQAPDGEDPARILSQRAAEGDPARARQ